MREKNGFLLTQSLFPFAREIQQRRFCRRTSLVPESIAIKAEDCLDKKVSTDESPRLSVVGRIQNCFVYDDPKPSTAPFLVTHRTAIRFQVIFYRREKQ